MNKEKIYKIIGYNGEYNSNVKKAIRKLLKENHPDNNGDRKVFELVNEVKKELENNKVSYDYHKKEEHTSKTNDGIDYIYCTEMIKSINKDKKKYLSLMNDKKNELKKIEDDYRDLYRKNVDTESILLLSPLNKKKINNIKSLSIIFVLLALGLFILSITARSITFFAIFVMIAMICILIINKYLVNTHKLMNFSSNNVKEYI